MTPIRNDVVKLIERFQPPDAAYCVVSAHWDEGALTVGRVTGPFETFAEAMKHVEKYSHIADLTVEPLFPPS